MTAIGAFFLVCGSSKSEFVLYRLFAARSRPFWGDNVHRFYQFVGVAIAVVGVSLALQNM